MGLTLFNGGMFVAILAQATNSPGQPSKFLVVCFGLKLLSIVAVLGVATQAVNQS